MSSVCHSYVLACHMHVTRMAFVCHCMYSHVIRMYVTRISFLYHRYVTYMYSYVLACHSYIARMWFYHEPFLTNANHCRKKKLFID